MCIYNINHFKFLQYLYITLILTYYLRYTIIFSFLVLLFESSGDWYVVSPN